MKILILGGGSDQCSLIEQCRPLGAEVIIADYYENPPARALADQHFRVSTLDLHAVLDLARSQRVDLVITACIDQALLTAAWVSEQLGLPCYLPYELARSVSNKAVMKQYFSAAGIPTPRTIVVKSLSDALEPPFPFPVVVKPADSNGSFGVTKATDEKEYRDAVSRALSISRTQTAVVDEYVEGDEISVDVFLYNGQASILLDTCSQKLPFARSAFPIFRSMFPSPLSREEGIELQRIVDQIVGAFGLVNTPLIVQLLRSKDGLRVIEFGARIAGGSKHHLIRRVTGFDVMKAFLDMVLGNEVSVMAGRNVGAAATTYVYSTGGTLSEVRHTDTLLAQGLIDAFFPYKTKGMVLENHAASRDRVGAYITTAPDSAQLIDKLARARSLLQVIGEDGSDMTLRP